MADWSSPSSRVTILAPWPAALDFPDDLAMPRGVLAMRHQPAQAYRVTGFVDDDPAKQRASIHGVTVLGTRRDLPRLIDEHQVQELLITPAAFAREDLRELADQGQTQYITVRFGNVLRSQGSVIPLFERQIEAGGPVTVTHPEMTRYFMSIPEAVRLVLNSGAIGRSGDLCILDMGQQVRILDLAENMIRMAGKVPHEDIEIAFTGIRPGEKLVEALFTPEEARTMHRVVRLFVSRPEGCDWGRFDALLGRLRQAAEACRREEIVRLLGAVRGSCRRGLGASRSARSARPWSPLRDLVRPLFRRRHGPPSGAPGRQAGVRCGRRTPRSASRRGAGGPHAPRDLGSHTRPFAATTLRRWRPIGA
ncbi:MAG: polysaccharide biosynthesis protein [Candidatus Latescibacterota bacterium]